MDYEDFLEQTKQKALARHQVFPSVLQIVQEYVKKKVKLAPGIDVREIGLEKNARLIRERVVTGIQAKRERFYRRKITIVTRT